MRPKRAAPRTLADVIRLQAERAMLNGEAALAAGDAGSARAWFERARRFVPCDPAVAAALAGVLLRIGDRAAGALFAEAAREVDTREIWLGAAAACLAAGDRAGARTALARALSSHVLPAERAIVETLAQLSCADSDVLGWCGVARAQNGELRWVAGVRGAAAMVDGAVLAGHVLPGEARSLCVTVNGHALLGSPIDLVRLRRVDGFVAPEGGGLAGWAWHPGDADHDPWIKIGGTGGTSLSMPQGAILQP